MYWLVEGLGYLIGGIWAIFATVIVLSLAAATADKIARITVYLFPRLTVLWGRKGGAST